MYYTGNIQQKQNLFNTFNMFILIHKKIQVQKLNTQRIQVNTYLVIDLPRN